MSVRDTSRVRFQDPSVASSCQIPWKKNDVKTDTEQMGPLLLSDNLDSLQAFGGPPKSPIKLNQSRSEATHVAYSVFCGTHVREPF